MNRWLRRSLRRCKIEPPFSPIICPEYVKTIHFDENWGMNVTICKTLVFLQLPEPADLYDLVPPEVDDAECVVQESPDALEVARVPARRGTRIYWKPRGSILRYASYVHQYGWRLPRSFERPALFTEFTADVRTGFATVEVLAPVSIEMAIGFKRPRWRRMHTERSLVKHAFSPNVERQGAIMNEHTRVTWQLQSPKVGSRCVCVMFSAAGLSDWERRLEETSLRGRVKRLIRSRRVPFAGPTP
jgi:hypothetical protein